MSGRTAPERSRPATDGAVVAAVDEIDGQPHLVFADVTRDGAWVAVAESVAVGLEDHA